MMEMFKFTVVASDSGIPQRSTTVPVAITVVHDKFAPEFVNTPYNLPQLPENKPVGYQVFQVQGRDRDQKVIQKLEFIISMSDLYADLIFSGCFNKKILPKYIESFKCKLCGRFCILSDLFYW